MGFGTKRKTRRPIHLGIEGLEVRVVPTVYHVTDVAELQADIAAANNSPVQNTIVMAPGLYQPTSEILIQNANLTILGKTTTKLKGEIDIFGGINNRMFDIVGGNVTLSGVNISGGGSVTEGGSIYSQNATLTLKNTFVAGGVASQAGGGIYVQGGTLNLDTCTISNNGVIGGSNPVGGGGIAASNAVINIVHSGINHNNTYSKGQGAQATANANGGGIYTQGGVLNITNSVLSEDVSSATSYTSATASGADIASSNTQVTVRGTTIENSLLTALSPQVNTMQGTAFASAGGSVTLANLTISGNTPDGNNEIYHPGATVVITNSTFDGQKISGTQTLPAQ